MRTLLLFLAMACAASGCRRHRVTHPPAAVALPDSLVAGTFITADGSWSHSDRGITRELTVARTGNEIAWTDLYTPSASGTVDGSFTLNSSADPWFVYVESTDRVWIFDGSGNLQSRTIAGPSMETREVISEGKYDTEGDPIPAGLVQRLPAVLQKMLPASSSRPSI